MTQQGLLSVKELSSYLGVSPCTVYRLVDRQAIPVIRKKGIGIRFHKEAIDEWLKRSTLSPATDLPLPPDARHARLTSKPKQSTKKTDGKSGGTSEMAKAKSRTRYNFGFGAIYQRKTKQGIVRWYLDYKNPQGKRTQNLIPHAASYEEAVESLREAVRKVYLIESGGKPDASRLGFKELATEYLERYSKVNKKSWKSDFYYLERKLVPFFGATPISEIKPLQIEDYIVKRLKDGVQKSSVNRELACLRKMFNKAVDWEYLGKSPMSRIKLFSEVENAKQRVLTTAEEERLVSSCPEPLEHIVKAAIHTGMRRGEILALEWRHVDLKKTDITVENTKSGRRRHIPINSALLGELSDLKRRNGHNSLVFPNPATGSKYTDIKRSFGTACRRAEIRGLRFHDLRHTFASRLVASGVDLITVKELLGHSSVKITERYTHSQRDLKERAVDTLLRYRDGESRADEGGVLLHGRDTRSSKRTESPVTSLISSN